MSLPAFPIPRPAPEQVIDLTDTSPLEALATAYADRLTAIGSGAGSAVLDSNEQRIRDLERTCRRTYVPARRAAVPDPALFLG